MPNRDTTGKGHLLECTATNPELHAQFRIFALGLSRKVRVVSRSPHKQFVLAANEYGWTKAN